MRSAFASKVPSSDAVGRELYSFQRLFPWGASPCQVVAGKRSTASRDSATMRVSYSAADLLDALLALRLRCVTAADAAHFLSHPEFDDRGDGSSLLVRLASTGKISPPRRHAIESLRRQWLAEHDGNVESC